LIVLFLYTEVFFTKVDEKFFIEYLVQDSCLFSVVRKRNYFTTN